MDKSERLKRLFSRFLRGKYGTGNVAELLSPLKSKKIPVPDMKFSWGSGKGNYSMTGQGEKMSLSFHL